VTACYGGHLRETEENNLLQAPSLIIRDAGQAGGPSPSREYTAGDDPDADIGRVRQIPGIRFFREIAFIIDMLPVLTSAFLLLLQKPLIFRLLWV